MQPSVPFAERREFCQFTDEDARLLERLGPAFEREAPEVVDRFYDHLTTTPALRPFLSDPATVERLKKAQVRYIRTLTGGNYDEEYAATFDVLDDLIARALQRLEPVVSP